MAAESVVKKQKLDPDSTINQDNSVIDLSDFQIDKILNNNTQRKTICVQGRFKHKSGVALILFEKSAFSERDFTNHHATECFSTNSTLEKDFINDIYGNYRFYPTVQLNDIKTTIIHPATEKHIIKFSTQNIYLINETNEIYKTVTLPFIEKEQFSLQWVYNILNHTSESERIVYEDNDPINGFILVPDLKWDGKTLETLYLIAIVHQKGIKSLRDLTGEHLPLLKNVLNKGITAIKDKYGLDSSQLRIYIHYQPSFYHLHIHFTYLKHDAPGIYAEKSHILTNVISNVTLLSDYYQQVTLPFVVRESDKLYEILLEKQLVNNV